MPSLLEQFGDSRPQAKIVANELEGKDFDNVLEVGFWWGESMMGVKDKFPNVKLVGIDIGWDQQIEKAKEATGLDLREGTVFDLPFKDDEFDVVFTNALFCMLEIERVEEGLLEIIRVAKKHIVLVELESVGEELFSLLPGMGRTGANWVELFKIYGLKATKRKVTEEEWEVNPWKNYGYVYYAKTIGN